MLNSGKKLIYRVLRNIFYERKKPTSLPLPPPPLQDKWSVPKIV